MVLGTQSCAHLENLLCAAWIAAGEWWGCVGHTLPRTIPGGGEPSHPTMAMAGGPCVTDVSTAGPGHAASLMLGFGVPSVIGVEWILRLRRQRM